MTTGPANPLVQPSRARLTSRASRRRRSRTPPAGARSRCRSCCSAQRIPVSVARISSAGGRGAREEKTHVGSRAAPLAAHAGVVHARGARGAVAARGRADGEAGARVERAEERVRVQLADRVVEREVQRRRPVSPYLVSKNAALEGRATDVAR